MLHAPAAACNCLRQLLHSVGLGRGQPQWLLAALLAVSVAVLHSGSKLRICEMATATATICLILMGMLIEPLAGRASATGLVSQHLAPTGPTGELANGPTGE
ncbi:hypothetical protein ACLKA7_009337 [Drosophila subpalustris]